MSHDLPEPDLTPAPGFRPPRYRVPPGVHTCHWPGCTTKVEPRFWGCETHWRRLPKPIRDGILKHYVPGQEERKDPTREYLDAAEVAERWAIRANERAAYRAALKRRENMLFPDEVGGLGDPEGDIGRIRR